MKYRIPALLAVATLAMTLAACGDSGKEAAAKAEAAAKEAAAKSAEAAKQAADAAVRLDLGLFIGSERAFACLGGERVHAVLVGGAETQRQNALGCRRGQRRFVWSCKPGQDGRLMVT